MNFAIIGCGLIGKKRAKAILDLGHSIRYVVDIDPEKARDFSDEINAVGISPNTWQSVLNRDSTFGMKEKAGPMVDAVVIATTHDQLAFYAERAIEAGKHVFIEKPGAISYASMYALVNHADQKGVVLRVGYNHRWHPGICKAYETHGLGDVIFIRGRYGHGGRIGYEKEWRMSRKMAGGGELMDQGVHLINLCQLFMGPVTKATGHLARYHWNSEVEDNAFVTLQDEMGRIAQLHTSWTEWKNMFSMEIFYQRGKIEVNGLGGSYGKEQVIIHRMNEFTMGPPDTDIHIFNQEDHSWKAEMDRFLWECQHLKNPDLNPSRSGMDAVETLRVVEEIYKNATFSRMSPFVGVE